MSTDLRPFMELIGNTVRVAALPDSEVSTTLNKYLDSVNGWKQFEGRVRYGSTWLHVLITNQIE